MEERRGKLAYKRDHSINTYTRLKAIMLLSYIWEACLDILVHKVSLGWVQEVHMLTFWEDHGDFVNGILPWCL